MQKTVFAASAASLVRLGSVCVPSPTLSSRLEKLKNGPHREEPRQGNRKFMNSIVDAAKISILFAIALLTPRLSASDDHNPIGVTGAFEGVITTGGGYNVLNHNATREIDDIVVPGSIGKYPLKMTRYYNSRSNAVYGPLGAGFTHG